MRFSGQSWPAPQNRSMSNESVFGTLSSWPPKPGEFLMPKKRHTPEQIIGKLREAEILLSQGQTVPEACKQIEVSEQTYYRSRKENGGLNTGQVNRWKIPKRITVGWKDWLPICLWIKRFWRTLPRETYKPCHEARGDRTSMKEASVLTEESLFVTFTTPDCTELWTQGE